MGRSVIRGRFTCDLIFLLLFIKRSLFISPTSSLTVCACASSPLYFAEAHSSDPDTRMNYSAYKRKVIVCRSALLRQLSLFAAQHGPTSEQRIGCRLVLHGPRV